MNFFKASLIVENYLCRFLSFYSPWTNSDEYPVTCKMTTCIIYVAPIIAAFVLKIHDMTYNSDVNYLLVTVSVVAFFVELYNYFYKYNVYNRTNKLLLRSMNETEILRILNIKHLCNKPLEVEAVYHYLLFLIKLFGFVFFVLRFLHRLSFATLMLVYRRIIVLSISCQWSLSSTVT